MKWELQKVSIIYLRSASIDRAWKPGSLLNWYFQYYILFSYLGQVSLPALATSLGLKVCFCLYLSKPSMLPGILFAPTWLLNSHLLCVDIMIQMLCLCIIYHSTSLVHLCLFFAPTLFISRPPLTLASRLLKKIS